MMSETPVSPGSVTATTIQVASKDKGLMSKLFGFLISKWRYSFTLIFVMIIILTGIVHSIQQNSLLPLFQDTGARIFSADAKLYERLANQEKTYPKYEKPESTIRWLQWSATIGYYAKIFYFYFEIFEALWLLYWFGYVFYKILSKFMIDSPVIIWSFTILVLAMFIIVTNLLYIIGDASLTHRTEITNKEILLAFVPFKGTIQIPFFIADILTPGSDLADIEIPGNATLLNVTSYATN